MVIITLVNHEVAVPAIAPANKLKALVAIAPITKANTASPPPKTPTATKTIAAMTIPIAQPAILHVSHESQLSEVVLLINSSFFDATADTAKGLALSSEEISIVHIPGFGLGTINDNIPFFSAGIIIPAFKFKSSKSLAFPENTFNPCDNVLVESSLP
jgi:hypothetical protein